jgi:hypothetical protein
MPPPRRIGPPASSTSPSVSSWAPPRPSRSNTCALEGIDLAAYTEILGLKGTGYEAVVACAVGYRSAEDKYASLKKVRFPAARVIRRV